MFYFFGSTLRSIFGYVGWFSQHHWLWQSNSLLFLRGCSTCADGKVVPKLQRPKFKEVTAGKTVVKWVSSGNSGFTHWKWWFSIAMLNYQRVGGSDKRSVWGIHIPNTYSLWQWGAVWSNLEFPNHLIFPTRLPLANGNLGLKCFFSFSGVWTKPW